MYHKKSVSQKERAKKILSFAVAAMNATNVLMPVAIPYVHIAKSAQQNMAQSALAQASVERMHLGMQILDQMIFSKAEAFTSPVENGEIMYEEIVSAGTQTILNGGTTIDGSILTSGFQTISSGGVASNTTINIGGSQIVSLGGSAIETTLDSSGTQIISVGGIALSTTINKAGAQMISAGGSAISTVLSNDGRQDIYVVDGRQVIYSGGSALSTTINAGIQIVDLGGSAIATTINSGGSWSRQEIWSSGIALSTTINSGGVQSVGIGGTSLNTLQNIGGAMHVIVVSGDTKTIVNGINESGIFSLANGTASNFVINSGAIHHVLSGGTSLNITQNIGGAVHVDVVGGDSKTIISGRNESGTFSLANGTASNFILNNANDFMGGWQNVRSGGIAWDTTVNSGAQQNIGSGGTSLNITQNSGGNVLPHISGGDTKTIVSGRNESGTFSLANGTATNFIIYQGGGWLTYGGSQVIYTGGVALNTTISSGGLQLITEGGTSLNIIQNSGANVDVWVSGGDTKTIVSGRNENGEFSLANGTATNFVLYFDNLEPDHGGVQYIEDGGSAISTTINSGGTQRIFESGVTISTTINSGGRLRVDGGTSTDIKQNIGGIISVVVDKTDSETILSGRNENGAFSLANGTATNFVLYSRGTQNVSNNGVAISTTINSSGLQTVMATGSAISTTINSAGQLAVMNGGTALNIVHNSGGYINVGIAGVVAGDPVTLVNGTNEKGSFSLANGTATNFAVYSGGTQYVSQGGLAISTTIKNGGQETVVSGGTATETAVYSGAQQNIHDAGLAISTTVNDGGSIYVHDGGSAANAVVNSGGIMYGQSNGTISDAAINSGGTLLLFRGAVVNSVSNSGTIDASKFNNGTIGALAGSNGVVLFNSDPYTPVIYSQVLNLGSISGSQTFDIAVDLKNNTADNLVIAGDASGTHYIKVTKEASPGSALSSLKGATTVVTVLGKDTSEFLGAQSSIDGLKIQPNIIHNDRFWQIDGYSVIGVSDLAKVAAAGADLNYAALYSGDSILRTRMGDIKDNLKNAGIWAKLSGGELAIDSNTLKHATFQGGYDKVHTGNNGTTVTGIMFERMEGSTTYTANGDGKLNNTRVGLYHTWFGNSGQYYDIVLKTGSMRNDINVYESEAVKGNYSAWNSSISFEYGNKKQLKNGYYINPLAKLSLGRINGATYTTNSDTLISQDGINSVLGRIGIGIGQNTERGRWYFNTAIVHEFTAKSKVTTGQGKFASTIENSLKGTALELSLGTSVQVSKSGLLYTDITKSFGGKVINKWQLQAGFRASF